MKLLRVTGAGLRNAKKARELKQGDIVIFSWNKQYRIEDIVKETSRTITFALRSIETGELFPTTYSKLKLIAIK